MSFERRGLPVAVWAPETVQLFEPAVQPSQMGFLRVCWRARRSSVEAVWVLVDSTRVWWLGREVRSRFLPQPASWPGTPFARYPTLRKSAKDGAPGFVVGGFSWVWDSSRGMSGTFS